MLVVQNGGTLTDSLGAVGNLSSSQGTVTVSGAGSTWTSDDIVVGGMGTGTLTIQNGGTVNSAAGGGSIGLSVGSTGTVTVTGSGSSWDNSPGAGLNIGSSGTGTLTIANGGMVINNTAFAANIGNSATSQGTVIVTGAGSTWINSSGVNVGNAGTGTLTVANGGTVSGTITVANGAGSIGTLNIGAAPGNAAVAPGTLNMPTVVFGVGAGTINFNHTSGDYVFAPAITGNGTVNVFAGTTIFTAANTYGGPTNVIGGTLRAGAVNTFSANSPVTVASAGTLDLNGFNQTLPSLTNAGLVNMNNSTTPGTLLTTINYVGTGGTIAMKTFLGADSSPSDQLVVNGGTATGMSFLHIANTGGLGAETTGNGILVVNAITGATTAPGAFALAGEVRAGEFDYDLFRGGLGGSDPQDWFLRSEFVAPNGMTEPIIGPELATYGVVQPIARELGLTTLGTLHERIGDTLTVANSGGDFYSGRPDWARFFGQQIDNSYQAFAAPEASGRLDGFQGGLDLWRGSLITGHRDVAGVYGAFGTSQVDVNGLVTNAAATNYVTMHTGTLNLNAYSAGAYWTHYGPGDWYLDAVVQGTWYAGHAATEFANLPTNGFGLISSLEAGDPIPLRWFGPGFVLEPQAQILWQQTGFDQVNDGLGLVGLGTTSGWIGRIGLRGQWTIVGDNGQVWQPYVRANIWRDWSPQSVTMFDTDPVPLVEQATWAEFAGGLTAKMNSRLSLYAQAGYQFAASDAIRRDGVRGDVGIRYAW